VRVDERVSNTADVGALGIVVDDFIAVDPQPEVTRIARPGPIFAWWSMHDQEARAQSFEHTNYRPHASRKR
jgi:hypothetical protein